MSAFGGEADMTLCRNSHLRSLLGAKRTCPFALHMSAFDPKRTCVSRRKTFAFDPKRGFAALMSICLLNGLGREATVVSLADCRQKRTHILATNFKVPTSRKEALQAMSVNESRLCH